MMVYPPIRQWKACTTLKFALHDHAALLGSLHIEGYCLHETRFSLGHKDISSMA